MFYTNLEEHRARLRYIEQRAEKARMARELTQNENQSGFRRRGWARKNSERI